MSMQFMSLKKIRLADLIDGRLKAHGVYENMEADGITKNRRCLTDGSNYLYADGDEDGFVTTFMLYRGRWDSVGHILWAISETLSIQIVSQYAPEFWGFATQDEWDAALDGGNEECHDRFYIDLIKYLRGDPKAIKAGTSDMGRAEIAVRLVAERPELMLPSKKEELLTAIDVVYEREGQALAQAMFNRVPARIRAARGCHEDDPGAQRSPPKIP
jgi:hypothetical protein